MTWSETPLIHRVLVRDPNMSSKSHRQGPPNRSNRLSPPMERYLKEVDDLKSFSAGGRSTSDKGEHFSRYIKDWDSGWDLMERSHDRTERLETTLFPATG